jgi:homoserine dehydrogenase
MHAKSIRVGMAGCGTVGCGVGDLLIRDHDALAARTGLDIRLVRVAIRDVCKSRAPHVPDAIITGDLATLNRADVDLVVELIGGTTVARQVVLSAIAAGKDVVTANKALLALHGPEIYAAARAAGVGVLFEGSVCGGLPVIGGVLRGLIANRIDAFEGILNGTCNYVLTEMLVAGKSFADALADAQRLGYAEADPALDINGTDTAHKLAVLATLAFGVHADFATIPVEGITRIGLVDLLAGHELGFACKLLAVGRMTEDGPALYVRPTFLTREHPFVGVDGRGNAVSFYGHSVGHVMFKGMGAGGGPTASAVVSDVVEIALGNGRRTFTQLPMFDTAAATRQAAMRPTAPARFYVRCAARGGAAAVSGIADGLRGAGVAVQEARPFTHPAVAAEGTYVILLTAPTMESTMRAAIDGMQKGGAATEAPVYLPVTDPFVSSNP